MKNLNLHSATDQELQQLRSQEQIATPLQAAPSLPQPTMRNAIDEYLWWLDHEKEAASSTATSCPQEWMTPIPSMISMATMNSMISTGDADADADASVGETALLHLPMYHAKYFVPRAEEESECVPVMSCLVSVHNREGVLSVLERVRAHPESFANIHVLDFSCGGWKWRRA